MYTHLGTLEAMIMPTVRVCKDSVLVLQAAVTPDWRVVDSREGATKRPGCWKWSTGEQGLGLLDE
jgi:hypothetical protein